MTALPAFTVLMATRNGAAHLPAQLASLAAQSHADWRLWVSDDGSTDATRALVQDFARDHDVRWIEGPQRGAAANFMHLLCHPDLPSGPVALSDQDDIWLPDKLARASAALARTDAPVLYGAGSLHIDEDGTPRGTSPDWPRGPSFENALVQNVVSGHSTALNAAALDIVRRAGVPQGIAFHDWWLYQLMTGAGAQVVLDAHPVLHYRQHAGNVMGSFRGPLARLRRLGLMLDGTFGGWMAANRAALIATGALTPAAEALLETVFNAPPGPARTRALRRAGVHRQSRADTAALYAVAALGRI
ncbi:glycosyltransferase [Sulfitobacter sp. 20_GPM-1509m]|uniref:glycosyltransferase n=1 Tax=Sulfitobacter sp. 20_GPM-1509m TaxID=1380367 RepID=UPI000491220F|nr:glycosyltransferase [Sulfitobacter sp. 20_GPM-1509m]